MSLQAHWFLPTAGDSRDVSGGGISKTISNSDSTWRAPDIDYLAQVARAAEQAGFTAVLTPTGTWCEDAWLTTAALTRETTRLKFLVAFRPGAVSPTLAAQMAATYQRISGGRLLLNVVTGGDPTEQQRFGDWLSHDERYARTGEFLSILRGAWSGTPYDFAGEHYTTAGATVSVPPDPIPPVFFGGASPAALDIAARHADVYLTWGEPPAAVAERIAEV
ncbi:MAG: alkanesulfonate monooxygenase, partial [Frankiales bacterium]|nr:alkanesulfonate monooxygenase [Frankiales bacterium]